MAEGLCHMLPSSVPRLQHASSALTARSGLTWAQSPGRQLGPLMHAAYVQLRECGSAVCSPPAQVCC
jgi:hypothetical protein